MVSERAREAYIEVLVLGKHVTSVSNTMHNLFESIVHGLQVRRRVVNQSLPKGSVKVSDFVQRNTVPFLIAVEHLQNVFSVRQSGRVQQVQKEVGTVLEKRVFEIHDDDLVMYGVCAELGDYNGGLGVSVGCVLVEYGVLLCGVDDGENSLPHSKFTLTRQTRFQLARPDWDDVTQ